MTKIKKIYEIARDIAGVIGVCAVFASPILVTAIVGTYNKPVAQESRVFHGCKITGMELEGVEPDFYSGAYIQTNGRIGKAIIPSNLERSIQEIVSENRSVPATIVSKTTKYKTLWGMGYEHFGKPEDYVLSLEEEK